MASSGVAINWVASDNLILCWMESNGFVTVWVSMGGLIINPRRVCAARVTVLGLCVCVCVCVSVTQHLTFHAIICATNDTNLLSGG